MTDENKSLMDVDRVRTETAISPFTPQSIAEAMKLAEMMAKSDLVPKDMKDKPGNVLVAIQMGMEVGLKPLQACQNIAVINGRPSIWGDAMLALVQGSGMLEAFEESFEGAGEARVAICEAKRRGIGQPFVSRFGVADAKKANLWGKAGPWQQYPDRMLSLRARGFCLRNGFADVLKGLVSREEAEDIPVDVPSKVVQPRRKSAPPPPPEPAVVLDQQPPPAEEHSDGYEPPPEEQAPPVEAPPPAAPPTAGSPDERLISEAQRKRFYAIAKGAGKSDDVIKAYIKESLGIERTDKMTRGVYEAACEWAAKK